jgi:hypothetical protein
MLLDTCEDFRTAVSVRCRGCEDSRMRRRLRRCVTGVFQACDKVMTAGETDVLEHRGGVTVPE